MLIASLSDTGAVRTNNQDSFAAGRIGTRAAWAVVCDGMGGAQGGNIASSLSVQLISDAIVSNYREGMAPNSVRGLLSSAVSAANAVVYEKAQTDKNLHGMGTTVVATLIIENTAYIVHAGDSRAYLLSDDQLKQITRDHSIVQSMIETGRITADEAKHHPNKHVITRAVGVLERVDLEYNEVSLEAENVLLLCTDGLSNFVSGENIKNTIKNQPFDVVPQLLVDQANQNGGGDNITVVVLSIKNA